MFLEFLWMMGLYNKCPKCRTRDQLFKIGFGGINDRWRCDNCGFGSE